VSSEAETACGYADALLTARAAGTLTGENADVLAAHLAACDACRELALALETSGVAEAVLGSAELGGTFEELRVVDASNYVRGGEIGRGGMGRIVRAHDRRLGRVVAIKQLIDARLAPRFEHEARLTARLQHPAIVTVYEAGRWPSGEPFYAMKYVAGRQLDEVVAELATLEERLSLLSNVTTAIEAIAYAHSEGVIHRDLKPQNILIGEFGETVVIDWGLAKDLLLEATGSEPYRDAAGPLTVGGVGTPAYMAPEQARGDAPDARVDVYALGATLHHVLAGDRPDRRALPEHTPCDLRDIVATAMADDPAARYPTAAELARELRRFQNGQLVASHRYTLGELIRRTLRRYRSIALVITAALAVLIAVAVVSIDRIVAERDRANAQSRIAEEQRWTADAQRHGAEQLVDFMLRTLPDRLEPIGKLELLAGVGKQVEAYFASVPSATETDATVLRQRADALQILGKVDLKKGSFDDAHAELERARVLCERLEKLGPTAAALACTAGALGQLASADSFRGQSETAMAGLDRERALLDEGLRSYPADLDLTRMRARVQYYTGREYAKRGDYTRALDTFHEAQARYTALLARVPDDLKALDEAAAVEDDLCKTLTENGRPDLAVVACQRDIALRERQQVIQPDRPEWEFGIASARMDTADAAITAGNGAVALATILPALPTFRRRADFDPANNLWQSSLAGALWTACTAELETDHTADGVRTCGEARDRYDHLLAKDPKRMTAAVSVIGVETTLSIGLVRLHDLRGAREVSANAVERADAWSREQPDSFEFHIAAGEAHFGAARAAVAEHRLDDARREAQAMRAALAAIESQEPSFLLEITIAKADQITAELDVAAGARAAAESRLRGIVTRLDAATVRWPAVSELVERRALAETTLGEFLVERVEARKLAGHAISALQALSRQGTLEVDYRGLAARASRLR